MIRPSSCNFILKGACPEEIEMVQEILNSYIEYGVTPGQAMSYEVIEEQPDKEYTWMIDLCDDGVLKMRHSSDLPEHECRVLYKKEDRARLIEQMVLMVSGMREIDVDYAEILPLLEMTCRFMCTDDSNGDLLTGVVSIVKEMKKAAQEKDVNDHSFLIQLCDCDMFSAGDIFNAIDDIEDSDDFLLYNQLILYRSSDNYKGTDPEYGIASIFAPVL